MPRVLDVAPADACSLAECVDALKSKGFDPRDEESLLHGALLLRRLGSDRSFMGDMLVCYRCGARHRQTAMAEEHPRFDLETAERYRQQDLRQRQASKPG